MGVTAIGSGSAQERVWQGVCKSPSAEINKTVDVGEGFELKDGVKIRVYFQGNSITNFTLNVNNTGDVDVILADGGELYSGLINQGYFNFTYTETELDSSDTVFAWILDNTQTGGTSTYGVVRVIDSPHPTFGASRGIATSPKALQAVKDEALLKTGGKMTGNLTIDVTESQANTSFIAVDYGDCIAEITVNESKPSIGLFGNGSGSVEMSATSNTSNATLSGNSSTLFLYGASSDDGSGTSALYIRNQSGNRRIYGLSPLGEGASDSHVAPKSYVDRMANFYAVECSGTDGKTYKRWGKGDNDIIYYDVSQPWYFEINQNRVLEVKITVTFDCTDYMSGIQVYGAKKSGSIVDFPLLMDIKAGNAVANRPATYTGTVYATVNSYVGATQGDGYGMIYASLYGDITKITNAKIMVEAITMHPFDW